MFLEKEETVRTYEHTPPTSPSGKDLFGAQV